MSAIQSNPRLPQKYWGFVAILCVTGALVSWFLVDKPSLNMVKQQAEESSTEEIQVEAVTAHKTLGNLTQEVPPLELKKRVVSINNDHGANFRGTKFIQANQKKWTVEVFRASEERVVLDYMQHHENEKELFYTRLSGENQEELYVVFYGSLKTKEGAQRLAEQLVTLDIPKTLKPEPKPFADYVKLVNEVGSEEATSGAANRLYNINLRPVALPKASTATATTPVTSSGRTLAVPPPVAPATRVVRPNPPVETPAKPAGQ